MTDSAAQKVLSRKAQAARRAIEAQGMSVEKALRRALARTAEEAWNLALIARDARRSGADQDDAAARFEGADLILLLDGPDGALGFALLDRQAVTALVEVQTLGIVTDLAVDDRRLTPTDAVIAAPLVDGTLSRLAAYLGRDPVAAQVEGYRFGAMVEGARVAANLLGAPRYRVFEAEIELGALRIGRFALILPARRVESRDVPDAGGDATPHAELMLSLPAQVDAVLCRMRLPFAQAEALAPGALLPLPPDALGRAELVAASGHRITTGRLGQMNGQRAIRVTRGTGARGDQSPREEDGAPGPAQMTGGAVQMPEVSGWTGSETSGDPDPWQAAGSAPEHLPEAEPDLPDLPPLDFASAEFDPGAIEPGEGHVQGDETEGFAMPLDLSVSGDDD
ncbi:Surface presentation of antigens (SPOA) [Roseivivax jejudonensis]|uniref:Surface presentation of antigens (SPOA) n=1 Tax=Roseivivax jejudonensis TaxID=1529041 RepID=A0A1X6Z882_9RHOB|nr:FliM/FliN family flagellar motor C-terminal domain-containing protein [Roseivivax jejudonensis]SLN43149.1 Surface presentation of antigens (SPOA) [Roseivivax jejudonensis]